MFMYKSLRILFALVVSLPARKRKTNQSDVKNEFLNGNLKEEVLIEQLKRFEKGKKHELRLRKSLYVLKRSLREWHNTLRKALAQKGVTKSNFDPSIFKNRSESIVITAFVDNLGSVDADKKEEEERPQHPETRPQMTAGEPINWMVGTNIELTPSNIRLSQMAYLERVLQHFGMNYCQPVTASLESQALTTQPGEAIEPLSFKQALDP